MADNTGIIGWIKENISILDVAQRHGLTIKKSSETYAYAECPFCSKPTDGKKGQYKLQFYLYSNSFSCHRCKRGGDVIRFVEEITPCDFIQALETLCRIAGKDLSPKEKEFYETNKDAWAVPSIYRFLLNCCKNLDKYVYEGGEYTPVEMAKIYLAKRGIVNEHLIESNEFVYIDLRKETISLLFDGSTFSKEAIAFSGVLAIPDFFYQDSVLMPIKAFQKIRQFISLSVGMKRERRDPKAMNMLNVDGVYAPRRIWGMDTLYEPNVEGVFVCESITDALCLQQEHIEKRFPYSAIALGSQYISELQREDLYKVPNIRYYTLFDKGIGEDTNLIGEQLAQSFGKKGFNVDLPLKTPADEKSPKDINDLYLLPINNTSIKVAYRGLAFAEMIIKSLREAIDRVITPPVDIDIQQLLFAEFMDKRVRIDCLPFSDIISTHSVPISVRAVCTGTHMCENRHKGKCILSKVGKRGKVIDIELDNVKIIEFCHTKKEAEIKKFWRNELKVPCKGAYIEIENEKTASVHQIELGPNIDYLTGFEEQTRFVAVRSYIVVPESEELPKMQPMRVEGRLVAHPIDNHEIILLGTKVERLPDAIEEFVVTDEVKESLEKFQTFSIEEMMDDLVHHTGITDSAYMHMAYILTYHSALHYHFLGADYLGCLHTLLLTDSSTGKSTLGKRLIGLFRLGEWVSCETAGRTGVTYSIVQTAGRWVVRWGAMPRNDRGFLILDEFQSFPKGESEHIKEAMSSGQLRVNRAAQDFTYTRNRLVIAANPKARFKGASCQLGFFDYPVEAIRTLFTTEAEIRRINLAILIRTADYATEILHDESKLRIEPEKAELTTVDWRNSVRWAWQRKADDIELEDEALKYLLGEASPYLVDKFKFAEDIPLFTASYTKHGILKLAIALASLLKSTDENFEKVVVKKEHIKWVADWLDEMYSSSTVKLDLYAAKRRQELYMTDEDYDMVIAEMCEGELRKHIETIGAYISMWTGQESWSTGMLKEAVEIDPRLVKKYNRICIKNMLVIKRSMVLNKTPKMSEFISRFNKMIKADVSLGLTIDDLIAPGIDIINLD